MAFHEDIFPEEISYGAVGGPKPRLRLRPVPQIEDHRREISRVARRERREPRDVARRAPHPHAIGEQHLGKGPPKAGARPGDKRGAVQGGNAGGGHRLRRPA